MSELDYFTTSEIQVLVFMFSPCNFFSSSSRALAFVWSWSVNSSSESAPARVSAQLCSERTTESANVLQSSSRATCCLASIEDRSDRVVRTGAVWYEDWLPVEHIEALEAWDLRDVGSIRNGASGKRRV